MKIETVIAEALHACGVWKPEVVEVPTILAALKAARIVVVELPEPTAPDFTGTEWSGPDWDVFAYGSTRHRGEVEVRSRRYNTPETAREFAAALLAAADIAEASQ
ncbi:hypothetical protein ABFW14_08515 [Mycolicibacterium fortuitum]|uniref:hypothetical protein n=1 Tax=Mycolicibacterium fortuitum TaxID=1766 RepID=UPI0034CF9C99